MSKQKILVFAGVFDPVHNGHVAIVVKALSLYEGSEAVVIAEKVPQHKHGSTSYQDRYAMLELAFSETTRVSVLEAPLTQHMIKPFFTWLSNRFRGAEFVWIVGSDVLPHIETWPGSDNLVALHVIELLCFLRSGYEKPQQQHVHKTPIQYAQLDEKIASITSRMIRTGEQKAEDTLDVAVCNYAAERMLYPEISL